MSDVPGAALLLGCLLVERWADRKPSLVREMLLGACIGASTYVRSIVVLLLPAIVVARVLRRLCSDRERDLARDWKSFVLRRVLPLLILTVAVKAPWDIRCALHHPEPPVDQNGLYSYSTAMWHVDGGDPSSPRRTVGELFGRIPQRSMQVLALLGSRMSTSSSTAATVLGAVLVALALVTLVRRRSSAELFALAATSVLLVYFGFRDRLVLPIYVCLLPAAVEGLTVLLRRPARERTASWIAGGLLGCLPAFDFRPRAGWHEIEEVHRAYTKLAEDVRAAVPPSVRMATGVGWHYAVFLERPVYSLYFGVKRAGDVRGVEPVLARNRIEVVVLCPRIPADKSLIAWFDQEHGPATIAGAARVYRIRGTQ